MAGSATPTEAPLLQGPFWDTVEAESSRTPGVWLAERWPRCEDCDECIASFEIEYFVRTPGPRLQLQAKRTCATGAQRCSSCADAAKKSSNAKAKPALTKAGTPTTTQKRKAKVSELNKDRAAVSSLVICSSYLRPLMFAHAGRASDIFGVKCEAVQLLHWREYIDVARLSFTAPRATFEV